jgi:glycosyltransferase involved in cell wall biosynthesis
VVDNGSDRAWDLPAGIAPGLQRLSEPRTGLTFARLCGIRAARGEVLVFVDDDNLLDPGYLAAADRRFREDARLAAAGGPVQPEWELAPPPWVLEFQGLLALRDLGPEIRIRAGGPGVPWPDFAPVGAGLVVRRTAALAYAQAIATDGTRLGLDRAGRSLASGGDNDLVFSALHGGGDVGYFPELRVTHLIPRARLEPAYLARLNAGIMRSWVLVLHLHGQCPWPPIPGWSVLFRCARAWVRTRAWRSSAHRVRWAGRCGQFRGQAMLSDFNASRD